MSQNPQKIGLILTGGGARAAYQVGVLKAIAEFMPRNARSPFQVICGTSAGALNAVTLAVNAQHFRKGVKYLLGIWTTAHVSDIYRSDALGVLKNSGRWLAGLVLSLFGIAFPCWTMRHWRHFWNRRCPATRFRRTSMREHCMH